MILDVDGSGGLGVGMQSVLTEQILSSELRLAVGGILINEDKLIVKVLCFNLPRYLSYSVMTVH